MDLMDPDNIDKNSAQSKIALGEAVLLLASTPRTFKITVAL